jgi:hypothetical protein
MQMKDFQLQRRQAALRYFTKYLSLVHNELVFYFVNQFVTESMSMYHANQTAWHSLIVCQLHTKLNAPI